MGGAVFRGDSGQWTRGWSHVLGAVVAVSTQPHQSAPAPARLPTNTTLWGCGSCTKQRSSGLEGGRFGKCEGGPQSDAIPMPSMMLLGDPVPTSLPRSQVVPEPEPQCDAERPASHLAPPSIPRPCVASPMVTAPKDPNHWVLLMLRMLLRLGAGEPWQPGKDGGCHGNERRSIRSWLWARDAPGGMGNRTRVLPQGWGMPKSQFRVQESCPGLRAAPGPQCLVGVGRWRLLGFRLCSWPCCSPTVPTPTITSGCSQAASAGRGARSCTVQRSNHLCRACKVRRGLLDFCSQEVCQHPLL